MKLQWVGIGPDPDVLLSIHSSSDLQIKPTLHIGHHLLEGKVVTLPKPLAVLLRSKPDLKRVDREARDHDQDDDDLIMMDCDGDPEVEKSRDAPTVGWNVEAIVKRKIVFSRRPMPIVGR